MKDNNGFTLVELLAVIVILAVVMLLAVTSVAPVVTRTRKGALGTEGVTLVNAAKTAFQELQINVNSGITATTNTCFTLDYLNKNGYYEKGLSDHYNGSVLIKYDNGNYNYYFWITNETYAYFGVNVSSYDISKAYNYNSNEYYDACSTKNITAPKPENAYGADYLCFMYNENGQCSKIPR